MRPLFLFENRSAIRHHGSVLVDRRCPPEPAGTAEAYLLGHLRADAAAAFEEHYLACPHCEAVLEDAKRFIVAALGNATTIPEAPHLRGIDPPRNCEVLPPIKQLPA